MQVLFSSSSSLSCFLIWSDLYWLSLVSYFFLPFLLVFFSFIFPFFSNLFQFSLSPQLSIDLYCLLVICDILVQILKVIVIFLKKYFIYLSFNPTLHWISSPFTSHITRLTFGHIFIFGYDLPTLWPLTSLQPLRPRHTFLLRRRSPPHTDNIHIYVYVLPKFDNLF